MLQQSARNIDHWYKKHVSYVINAIGIQSLCCSLNFGVFQSLIITIVELLQGSYNAHRCCDRQIANYNEQKTNAQNATGSKYKSQKTNHKNSEASVNRSLKYISNVFKEHQSHFNNDINLRDAWRSKDLKQNPNEFIENRHLARQWKIQTRLREKRLLKKFKNNADRITRLTFMGHKYLMSYNALEAYRHAVCNTYVLLQYKTLFMYNNIYHITMF